MNLLSTLTQVETIAAICHSASRGHTVILSQTEKIHESFYGLFNLRFRCIDDPKSGCHYYAHVTIGAHLKPCRVHPDFQCIVLMREADIPNTPSPFLNRFEKYHITHKSVLDAAFERLPCGFKSLLEEAMDKVMLHIDAVVKHIFTLHGPISSGCGICLYCG